MAPGHVQSAADDDRHADDGVAIGQLAEHQKPQQRHPEPLTVSERRQRGRARYPMHRWEESIQPIPLYSINRNSPRCALDGVTRRKDTTKLSATQPTMAV